MRNAEVIRQWKILKRIEAGRYTTAQDLADEHGVTERTIRRDIEALQEAGFPLYDERADGPQGLAAGRGLQAAADPDLHPGRAGRALLQQEPDVVPGRRALRPGPGVRLREDPGGAARAQPALPGAHPGPVLRAARPLEGLLGEAGRDRRAHRRRRCTSGRRASRTSPSTASAPRPTRSTPTASCTTTAASTSTRAPTSTARCAPSPWSASRRSRCSTQTFEMPADFNVSEYARGAFGIAGGKPEPVEVVFDAEMAGYIRERVWHESQALEDGPGRLRGPAHERGARAGS